MNTAEKVYSTTIQHGEFRHVEYFTMKDVKAYGTEATVKDYIDFLHS